MVLKLRLDTDIEVVTEMHIKPEVVTKLYIKTGTEVVTEHAY